MGLVKSFMGFCKTVKADIDAPQLFKKALKQGDTKTAVIAINNFYPRSPIHEDPIVKELSSYAHTKDRDLNILKILREVLYDRYDAKSQLYTTASSYDNEAHIRSENIDRYKFSNPLLIYAMAAYLDDVTMLKHLYRDGITPDTVTSTVLTESIITGTIAFRSFDSMKEVIKQGASLDLRGTYDDIPPIYALGKPLFHYLNPSAKKHLVDTGNARIIDEIKKIDRLNSSIFTSSALS
jgi:hypothetical protein